MPIDIPPNGTALPIARRKKRRHKKAPADRPMSQDERNALQFEAIKAEFHWSDDEWASTWLPWVRCAACVVGGGDQDWLKKELMSGLVADGEAPDFLEGLARTKMQLEAMRKLVDVALTRSFVAVEQLGYSPENLLQDPQTH